MRVRTEARRDAILEAAAKLFEEAGFEGASMSELSRRLGGSKTTLYGYFPSKEELFVAVVRKFTTAHLAEATAIVLSALDEKPALGPLLKKAGGRVLQVMLNDRRAIVVYRMVLAEAGRSDIGLLFHDAGPSQFMDALARLFARAVECGAMRKLDPMVTAMQFLGLLTAESGARLYQRNPLPVTAAEIARRVDHAVDFFLEGVRVRTQP